MVGPAVVHFVGDGDPDIATPSAFVSRLSALAAGGRIVPDHTSRGGSVGELEEAAAKLFGKEAALWTPTGTMANILGISALCGSGRAARVILPAESHVYNDTGDGLSRLLSLHPIPLAPGRACFTGTEAAAAIEAGRVGGRVSSLVGACVVESPVRRKHGELVPLEQMREICAACQDGGVSTHLDGARLDMMCASLGVEAAEVMALFDTVYIDVHKYFGAPFGALLLGTKATIEPLYHERRMLGGGMENACIGAALALEGLVSFPARSRAASHQGSLLVHELGQLDGLTRDTSIGGEHPSNIFGFTVGALGQRHTEAGRQRFTASLGAAGVRVNTATKSFGQDPSAGDDVRWPRLVLHLNPTLLRRSNEEIVPAFEAALAVAAAGGGGVDTTATTTRTGTAGSGSRL